MSRALGRYELLRPLARGGMAEVYLARRRAAGVEKWLVVKRMRPERAGDARFLDLFVREARLSMSLAHQNIVPVFDFGRIDDQVFIAMERVEGKDLGSSLTRAAQHGVTMPPVLAAFVAAECCQALDYAHRRRGPDGAALGIVHRDVTPRNVLLSWSGEVKLTDFGIAALAGDVEAGANKVIGTPAYMAPEQARGDALDPRADLYALGMVLREALTGIRPRPGDERELTLAAARKGQLVPWPEGFESPLVALVDKATALDPEARYPDARAMLEELDAFIVGERAAKKSDSPTRRLAAWLAEVWKEEREETAIDEAIEGSHLVSFLDDGALDVIGTGTVRSMAMTASDVVETPKPDAAAPAAATPDVTERVAKGEPVAKASDATAARRRPWLLPALAVGGLAVGAIAILTRSPERAAPAPAPPVNVATTAPDAAPVIAEVHLDAAVVAEATPDATPPDAPPPRVDAGVKHSTDAQLRHVGSAAPPLPTATKHTVLVNAKPWAYFTIDGDTTQYQTLARVTLTVGEHVLHFTHEGVTKDVTITVPDSDDLKVLEDLTH